MYKRYYDGYPSDTFAQDSGEAIKPAAVDVRADEVVQTEAEIAPADSVQSVSIEPPAQVSAFSGKGFLGSLRSDDIILIALLFILMGENQDDFIMPILIGALLLGR